MCSYRYDLHHPGSRTIRRSIAAGQAVRGHKHVSNPAARNQLRHRHILRTIAGAACPDCTVLNSTGRAGSSSSGWKSYAEKIQYVGLTAQTPDGANTTYAQAVLFPWFEAPQLFFAVCNLSPTSSCQQVTLQCGISSDLSAATLGGRISIAIRIFAHHVSCATSTFLISSLHSLRLQLHNV